MIGRTNLFVPATAPDAFEAAFIDAHPALGLRLTSNSGAYWGDGDARMTHVDHGRLQFALEAKTRVSDRKTSCRPTSAEWAKAMGDPGSRSDAGRRGQLRKFHPKAVRLFAVYNTNTHLYEVWLPEADAFALENQIVSMAQYETTAFRRGGQQLLARRYTYAAGSWMTLYHAIDEYQSQ